MGHRHNLSPGAYEALQQQRLARLALPNTGPHLPHLRRLFLQPLEIQEKALRLAPAPSFVAEDEPEESARPPVVEGLRTRVRGPNKKKPPTGDVDEASPASPPPRPKPKSTGKKIAASGSSRKHAATPPLSPEAKKPKTKVGEDHEREAEQDVEEGTSRNALGTLDKNRLLRRL